MVCEDGPSPTSESVPVAADRIPTPRFDTACDLAIQHLTRVAPVGMWAVTRIVDGQQLMLALDAPAYDIVAGAQFPFADSFCRFMVSGAAPQIAPEVEEIADYAAAAAIAPVTVRAYLGAPIVRGNGELFGTVCGYDPHSQPESLRSHQHMLELVSGMLSAVLDADTIATSIARERDLARHDAETDPLTALLNRRGGDRHVRTEEPRLRRLGDQACVIAIDLDRLKAVNDAGGHAARDQHIRRAARVLAANVRRGDVLARLGGDEFGILAVGASPGQTGELVTRLEDALREAGVPGCAGFAPYHPTTGLPIAWESADQAMYQRKQLRRHTRIPATTR